MPQARARVANLVPLSIKFTVSTVACSYSCWSCFRAVAMVRLKPPIAAIPDIVARKAPAIEKSQFNFKNDFRCFKLNAIYSIPDSCLPLIRCFRFSSSAVVTFFSVVAITSIIVSWRFHACCLYFIIYLLNRIFWFLHADLYKNRFLTWTVTALHSNVLILSHIYIQSRTWIDILSNNKPHCTRFVLNGLRQWCVISIFSIDGDKTIKNINRMLFVFPTKRFSTMIALYQKASISRNFI